MDRGCSRFDRLTMNGLPAGLSRRGRRAGTKSPAVPALRRTYRQHAELALVHPAGRQRRIASRGRGPRPMRSLPPATASAACAFRLLPHYRAMPKTVLPVCGAANDGDDADAVAGAADVPAVVAKESSAEARQARGEFFAKSLNYSPTLAAARLTRLGTIISKMSSSLTQITTPGKFHDVSPC